MGKPQVSLEQFAKLHPTKRGPICSVCSLPPDILAVINASCASGEHGPALMARWLVSLGYNHMNRQRLDNHKNGLHYERKAK